MINHYKGAIFNSKLFPKLPEGFFHRVLGNWDTDGNRTETQKRERIVDDTTGKLGKLYIIYINIVNYIYIVQIYIYIYIMYI